MRNALAPIPTFDEQTDCYTLLYIKNILILTSVRRPLLLLCIPVEIEHVYPVKRLSQRFAHALKCGIIEPCMVCDDADHSIANCLHLHLREADKLHIVVL